MLNLETIGALREFLRRTTLKGDEVDAFNRCVGSLFAEEQITRKYLADEERAMLERNRQAALAEQAKAELEAAEPVVLTEE